MNLFLPLVPWTGYEYFYLDGTTLIPKQQKLVDQLNDPHGKVFVFLLSSKASGCGINLIGANRLILFDPSIMPYNCLGKISDYFHHNNKNNWLERRVWPPKDIS